MQDLPEGTVTVLFTDVVGSTELTNRLGDDAAREVLGACDNLVREQVARHRGQEVKGTGDGLMVAFTSARRAIACATDIQRAAVELARTQGDRSTEIRIGVNTGEVIREEADLFGATVNAAQRIANHAGAGQILVSEGVKMVLGSASSVDLEDRGEFELRGFPDKWRLYEVVWQAAPVPTPSGGRTPYVGRDNERAELRRRLQEALNGRGTLVMIGGEPGVGKTRIAEELMAEATERGALCLIGHCYETEGSVPYLPFVEMLESAVRLVDRDTLRDVLGESAPQVAKLMPELQRLYPDIPNPPELPPEQERHYLFNGMREYLARACEAQPLLFVLDDLHWADDSTLQLMQHLAQDLPERRLLMVGTYRDVELDVGRPLARTLENLLRQRIAHRISLRRLPEGSVASMLKALSGQEPPDALVHVVYSETEGNPFFVEEVFQHLAEEGRIFDDRGRWRGDLSISELDVPEGVRLVVGRRLERVGDDCRRALGAAAVIGRRFRYELLELLDELDPERLLDAMDDAGHAQLVVAEESGAEAWYTFAHELIRQTLLSGLSLPRRQRMHLKVADAMERLYGRTADDRAPDIAHHLYQAGAAADRDRTLRYLSLAGDQALAAAAFEEAARQFENALSLLAPDDRGDEAALLHKRGLAIRSLGRWEDALNDWRRALPLYEEAGNTHGAVDLCLAMTQQLGWNTLWLEATNIGQHGLTLVGNDPSPERGRLLAFTGFTTSLGRSYTDGLILVDEAEAVARELNDELLLGRALAIKGSVNQWHARPREALEYGMAAIPLLRKRDDLWQLADTLFMTSYASNSLGKFAEAEKLGRESGEIAGRIGHLGGVMAARRGLAVGRLAQTGDIDEFETFAREDLELARQADMPWVANAHTNIGLVHFWRGQWEQALTEFATAVALEPAGMLDGWDSMHAMVARASAGDEAGALELLEEKKALLPKKGAANNLGSWSLMAGAVQVYTMLRRPQDAAAFHDLALEALPPGAIVVWPVTLVRCIAGIAAAAAERWDEAEEHFEEALRQAQETPVVIAQPEARRAYARMLLDRNASGDREKARRLLEEAAASYRGLKMPRHEALAEALLRES